MYSGKEHVLKDAFSRPFLAERRLYQGHRNSGRRGGLGFPVDSRNLTDIVSEKV